MQKKGQIMLFIVLGIIILIIISSFLLFRGKVVKEELLAEEKVVLSVAPIKNFVKQCIERTAEEGIYYIGMQGGYYRPLPPFEPYYAKVLPYYFYGEEENFPDIKKIEQEHADYVKNNLHTCFNDFEIFAEEGFEISTGIIQADTTFGAQTKTIVTIPLDISIGDQTTTLKTFQAVVDFDYQSKYAVIKNIVDEIKSDKQYFPIGYVADLAHENDFTFEFVSMEKDNSAILSLRFPGVERPYIHSFLILYGSPEPELFVSFSESNTVSEMEIVHEEVSLLVFEEGAGGDVGAAPAAEVQFPQDYTYENLRQDYGIDIGTGGNLQNVQVIGDQATIIGGEEAILKTTDKISTVDAQSDVLIDASTNKFSGTITSTTGDAKLILVDDAGFGVSVALEKGSSVELKDGKIVKADKITIIPEADEEGKITGIDIDGSDVSGFELSYDAGTGMITAGKEAYRRAEIFIDGRRFTSDNQFEVELISDIERGVYTLHGDYIAEHDSEIPEQLVRVFTGSVVVLPQERGYNLLEGTIVDEYVLGKAVASFESKGWQTGYFPNIDYGFDEYQKSVAAGDVEYDSLDQFVRKKHGMSLQEYLNSKGCDGKLSCIEFDRYHNLRVVAQGNADGSNPANLIIEIGADGVFPSLAVDGIDDSSTVTFQQIGKDSELEVEAVFSEEPVKITDPSKLQNLRTRIVTEYADKEGNPRTFILHNDLQQFTVIENGNPDPVGYYSEWAVENHYKLDYGVVMSKEDYDRYKILYNQLINDYSVHRYAALREQKADPIEEEFFILLASQLRDDKKFEEFLTEYYNTQYIAYRDLAKEDDPSFRHFFLRYLIHEINEDTAQEHPLARRVREFAEQFRENPYLRMRFYETFERGGYENTRTAYGAFEKFSDYHDLAYENPQVFNRLSSLLEHVNPQSLTAADVLNYVIFKRDGSSEQLSNRFLDLLMLMNDHYSGKEVDFTQIVDGKIIVQYIVSLVKNMQSVPSYRHENYANMYLGLIELGDKEAIDVLDKIGEKRGKFVHESMSAQETEKAVQTLLRLQDKYYNVASSMLHDNAIKAMEILNDLGNRNLGAQRRAFAAAIPLEFYPHVFATGSEGLGDDGQLWVSSYDVLMDALVRKTDGYEKIIPAFEGKGFTPGESMAMQEFLMAVAGAGDYHKIMPADKEKQREYIRFLLKRFSESINNIEGLNQIEDLNQIDFSIAGLFRDEKTKDTFREVIFQDYQNAVALLGDGTLSDRQRETLESNKRVLQYWLIDNEEHLGDLRGEIIPDSRVLAALERGQTIPLAEWLEHAEVRNGRAVIKGKVFFSSAPYERSEVKHMSTLANRASELGYKIKQNADGGYILSKPMRVRDPSTGQMRNVIVELEVVNGVEGVGEALTSPQIPIVVNRGHSYHRDMVWRGATESGADPPIRKLAIDGSCWGAKSASSNQGLNDFDFVGTTHTGFGVLNNDVLLLTIEALGDGVGSYEEIPGYVLRNYDGPSYQTAHGRRFSMREELRNGYRYPQHFLARLLVD